MKIIPAVDLMNGKCVRLYKGDFSQETVYYDEPVVIAKKFENEGAEFLHVIDLDGARNQKTAQTKIIKRIAKETNLKLQVGGGIRSKDNISDLLDAGIEKVIVGSLACKERDLMKVWLDCFGSEKIVAAFDIKIIDNKPLISTAGWQEQSMISLWDILTIYSFTSLKHVLCTDIDCDGTLAGPNFSLYEEIMNRYPDFLIQASGGVSSISDIESLKNIGLDGVIVGKALYEDRLTLEEMLNVD